MFFPFSDGSRKRFARFRPFSYVACPVHYIIVSERVHNILPPPLGFRRKIFGLHLPMGACIA